MTTDPNVDLVEMLRAAFPDAYTEEGWREFLSNPNARIPVFRTHMERILSWSNARRDAAVVVMRERAAQLVDCGCKDRDKVLAAKTKVDMWWSCAAGTDCLARAAADIRALDMDALDPRDAQIARLREALSGLLQWARCNAPERSPAPEREEYHRLIVAGQVALNAKGDNP